MKKTAGQIILEHDAQRLDTEDDVIEYRRAMEPEILAKIHSTAQQAKQNDSYKGKDFYVVLITTTDPVLRHAKIVTLARKSCPTPVYKQSVWKYHNNSDQLEFLWSIPDEVLYWHIIRNAPKLVQDEECNDITKFVMLMESGELLRWVKKENGEKIDAVIKINKEELHA
jgi:hypothetical protein